MPICFPERTKLGKGDLAVSAPQVSPGSYFCMREQALHTLVGKGDVEGVVELLQRGHNVNCTNMQGETPLHRAIEQQNLPLVRLLLKHGADASMIPNYGVGSLYQAVETGNVELVKILLDTQDCSGELNLPNQTNPLMAAVVKENVEVTRMLLQEGARVNITNDRGETPLFLVAMGTDPNKQLQLGILLLRFGANPSQKDPHGHTPEHYSWHNTFTAYMREYSCISATPDQPDPIPTPMEECNGHASAEEDSKEDLIEVPSLLSMARRAVLFQLVLTSSDQQLSVEDKVRFLAVPQTLRDFLVFNN